MTTRYEELRKRLDRGETIDPGAALVGAGRRALRATIQQRERDANAQRDANQQDRSDEPPTEPT